ncbi:ComEC/Rec2 family competence protein [Methanobrevibacter ruminantium]|uniref:ComEC/Rec2 family competence protein n=1 Tax=Methanobrevibacter ruminantium TaxID=83816 RepID=UPI003F044930
MNLGNCTLIQTEKLNMLFDIGTNDLTGENPLFSFEGNLDYLIITHPHKDHISGLIDIDKKKPTTLLRNKLIPPELITEAMKSSQTEKDKEIFKEYIKLHETYTHPTPYEINPNNPQYNGNVKIIDFLPSKNDIKDLNYYSISTFIEYEGFKILLMGDNTLSNIEELLNNSEFVNKTKNIDILLAPHHGRATCYSPELLDHLNPVITIISDMSGQGDVTAADEYSYKSRGMNVFKNGWLVKRNCLTTRNDGNIYVKIEKGKLEIACDNRC